MSSGIPPDNFLANQVALPKATPSRIADQKGRSPTRESHRQSVHRFLPPCPRSAEHRCVQKSHSQIAGPYRTNLSILKLPSKRERQNHKLPGDVAKSIDRMNSCSPEEFRLSCGRAGRECSARSERPAIARPLDRTVEKRHKPPVDRNHIRGMSGGSWNPAEPPLRPARCREVFPRHRECLDSAV